MADIDTKTLILDTAEQEFADKGFGAVSLRHIMERAGVNPAAIHYHFGGKEALVSAVFARRIGWLTQERMALLDSCEAAAGNGPLSLETLLEAFVGPALRMTADPTKGGKVFVRLFGRTMAEPSDDLQYMLNTQFGLTVHRFHAAFQRALPELPSPVLLWRFQFVIGAMGYVMADPQNIKVMSGGLCDPADTTTAIKQLVDFLSCGLRAPVTHSGRKPRQHSSSINP